MVDNLDVQSTSASSDISDSVREQILGRPFRRKNRQNRRGPVPVTQTSADQERNTNHEFSKIVSFGNDTSVEGKEQGSSFEIVEVPKDSGSQNSSYVTVEGFEGEHQTSSFENVSQQKSEEFHSTKENIEDKKSEEVAGIEEKKSEEVAGIEEKKSEEVAGIEEKKSEELTGIEESINETPSVTSAQSKTSRSSMRNLNSNSHLPLTQPLTQTVGIQTNEDSFEEDSKRDSSAHHHEHHCNCCPRGLVDKEVNVPDETTEETLTTDSSHQTLDVAHMCKCRGHWDEYDTQTSTDHLSDNSDDSFSTDFFDLPYQNNEEYLKLLKELEKKLIARNKERVRRTMLEFEKRSRQNQNLDKPICDYSDDNASLLRKLKTISPKGRKCSVCCRCGRNKKLNNVNSDIMQNEKRWDDMVSQSSDCEINKMKRSSRVARSLHKSHWQMDPRSGEWIKVSCFQQTDYTRHPPPPVPPQGDFLKDEKCFVPPPMPKECRCKQKRRH